MGFVCYSYSRLQFIYICYDIKLHIYIHMLNLLDNNGLKFVAHTMSFHLYFCLHVKKSNSSVTHTHCSGV